MYEESVAEGDPRNLDWLKKKLKAIWTSPKFCGLCLETSGNFCSVKMEMLINNQNFSTCLQDIINYVFNDDMENLMSSKYLCDTCAEKTIQSYIFIHNTKQLSRIMNNCVNDLNSKVIDISDQVQGSNEYANSNVMIVLESEMDLWKSVMDSKKTEVFTTATPIAMKRDKIQAPNLKLECQLPKEILNPEAEEKLVQAESNPNITLKKGHIVIKPLSSARNFTPRYNTYVCASCPDIFTTYRSLKEHEKAKHKTSVFHCNLCDKSYNTRQYLNIHYKTHAKAKCKFCQLILPEDELMEHLRKNHSFLVFPCGYCDLVYYSHDSLVTHFNSSHLMNNTKAQFQCIMCLRSFKESEMKKHKCKFSCSECFVMPCIHYRYLRAYREQVLNHTNKLACIDCDYVTRRKEHLIGHVNREHLDHHPFTCDNCSQQFYTKLSLKTHIVQFHQDLNCEYCDFSFKDNNTLENHRKVCKLVLRPFGCNRCTASFDLEEELTAHENLRHSESVYPCNLCKGKFLTNLALEEHRARAHGGIQCKKRRRHIECSLCDIMFKNTKELLEHEKLHDADDAYPCKMCPKEFKSLMKLYVHNHRHYTNRIKCPRCNKNVAESFYKQHSVRCPYRKDVALGHVCEVCGKSFHLESLLRFHQRVHMAREPCPKCDKVIKPSSLKRHMEQIHGEVSDKTKKKPVSKQPSIECEMCGHTVRKRHDLEAHMNRYHLKIKPYVCHICSKDFCGKIRLKEHLATHTTTNSILCSVCHKKFANRVCLKMHFRMHTGELPYACDICEQRFRSSSMMKTHRLKKHLDKTVGCPLCDSMFYMARDMRHHFKKVHWKFKDKPFNVREVEELSPEFYSLFEDGRLPKLDT
ncbi:zinc finger protein 532-like isoform X2 [Anticarsia gemmatalis]